MGYSHHKSKKDDNHNSVQKIFDNYGFITFDMSSLRLGFDFIAVRDPIIVEVKDGSKPKSKRKLTIDEIKAQKKYGIFYHVIDSNEEARNVAERESNRKTL